MGMLTSSRLVPNNNLQRGRARGNIHSRRHHHHRDKIRDHRGTIRIMQVRTVTMPIKEDRTAPNRISIRRLGPRTRSRHTNKHHRGRASSLHLGKDSHSPISNRRTGIVISPINTSPRRGSSTRSTSSRRPGNSRRKRTVGRVCLPRSISDRLLKREVRLQVPVVRWSC